MKIKILGPGCPKCQTLEQRTREVVSELQLNAEVLKVEDIMDIMHYGVMMTPAMVIEETVVIKGRLPSKEEISESIKKFL